MSNNSKKLNVMAKNSSRKQTFQIADQDSSKAHRDADADKLRQLLQAKQRQNEEEAMHIEDTHKD